MAVLVENSLSCLMKGDRAYENEVTSGVKDRRGVESYRQRGQIGDKSYTAKAGGVGEEEDRGLEDHEEEVATTLGPFPQVELLSWLISGRVTDLSD